MVQRWPGGAEQPEGCGPGCWTNNPHHSCKDSTCHKRQKLTKSCFEHILKPKTTQKNSKNKEGSTVMSCTWTFSIISKQQSQSKTKLSTMLAACTKMCIRVLTWTPGRRPQHRWRGRAPSGWRCVPVQQGSEHA